LSISDLTPYSVYYLCILFIFFKVLSAGFLYHFFFFNDTSSTEIYTLSLHDALPISATRDLRGRQTARSGFGLLLLRAARGLLRRDRKSTRLNSSHVAISYAVFCLKKKNEHQICRGEHKSKRRDQCRTLLNHTPRCRH